MWLIFANLGSNDSTLPQIRNFLDLFSTRCFRQLFLATRERIGPCIKHLPTRPKIQVNLPMNGFISFMIDMGNEYLQDRTKPYTANLRIATKSTKDCLGKLLVFSLHISQLGA